MRGGEPVQAFTAIGRIKSAEPYVFDMGSGVVPARRDVAFVACKQAPIRPLIDRLGFIKNKKSWAYPFRLGILSVPAEDFRLIAEAMQADLR
jgi:hypothetical protein